MPRIQSIHQPAELKNRAINGALDFWQEKVGTTSTVNTASSTDAYSADMWSYQSGGPTTKNYSVVRSAVVPTVAQAGIQAPYSILFTMLTGISSFGAADFVNPFNYRMEGFDFSKIHMGVITVGFWIQASIAGTYSVSFRNAAANRSYVTTVVVNQPNTPEFKSVTLTLDQSGTWLFDNGVGLNIQIAAYAGSTYQTSSLNTWQSGNFVTASTATNWMATSNATVRLSLFSITQGTLGFGPTGFQRAGKTIQQEFAMCQRYLQIPGRGTGSYMGAGAFTTASNAEHSMSFPVEMRAAGTVTVVNPGTFRVNNASNNYRVTSITYSEASTRAFRVGLTVTPSGTNGAATATVDNDAFGGGVGYMMVDSRL